MKIALDAMGGDFAPGNMIAGAKMALAAYGARQISHLYLTGDEGTIKAELQRAIARARRHGARRRRRRAAR